VIPLALSAMAILDGALCGFRAAAGKDGRIAKHGYYWRAAALGLGAATVAVALAWAEAGLLYAIAGDRAAVWRDFLVAGAAAMRVLVPYSALAIVALVPWMLPANDARILATVMVLGPFTLARPFVILAGLGCALAAAPRASVLLLVAGTGAAMLLLEPLLARRWRVDETLLQ
jgi:hypothetical protein